MTASNTYGRQVVVPLTNKSGGGVIAGDVVIIDTTNNEAFTTTTSGGFTGLIGIAQETIANNATGRVLLSGYAALVNVNASVTRGNYGKTYTVAKQATDAGGSRVAGTFCQFLTGGTTPTANVYSPDSASASTFYPGSTLQRISRTAGDISMAQHTTMTELSSALRLTIAAATGDVLQIGYSGIAVAGAGGEFAIDSATIVSGSITNQVSAGTRGIGHGFGGTAAVGVGGTLTYTVVSGDVSGGNVIVSPTYIQSSASAGTAYADTTYALTYWVVNLKH